MPFWEYELRAETLCLGERVKGGLYRPCDTHAIRYSAVTGALRQYFGVDDLHAAGYFVEKGGYNQIGYLTYAPHDDAVGLSKLPLTIQFVANVLGRVVVKATRPLPKTFELGMGAMKSQGFGDCQFRLLGEADLRIARGYLRTRLPVHRKEEFMVQRIVSPIYGYLFEPTSLTSGEYVLSLFEGSEIYGPVCLVREEIA